MYWWTQIADRSTFGDDILTPPPFQARFWLVGLLKKNKKKNAHSHVIWCGGRGGGVYFIYSTPFTPKVLERQGQIFFFFFFFFINICYTLNTFRFEIKRELWVDNKISSFISWFLHRDGLKNFESFLWNIFRVTKNIGSVSHCPGVPSWIDCLNE